MFRSSMGLFFRPLLLSVLSLWPIAAQAAIGTWTEPGLDRWLHQDDSAPGLKPDMSTFANFEPGAGFTQARAGSLVLGFNTSDQIPLVASNRYQIHSIKFTLDFVHDNRTVTYDPTVDALSSILGNTDDPGRPIELFGVGYGNGYQKLGFVGNDSLPPEFEESSPLWPTNLPTLEQTFNVFPLGDDGTGNFGNVFNSPGGEGEFQYDEVEEEYDLVEITKNAWNTTPWAIGTSPSLTAGQTIPNGARFHFNVNLALPGVLEYFQQTLAMGQAAVFISSLHDLSGFHSGGLSDGFPAFHSKESLWVEFELALPPTLEIDYTILPESNQPGDFDGDVDVDADDLADWQASYGINPGGDADEDGDSDGRDFLIWQRNYTGPGPLISAVVVPEPTSTAIVISCIILMSGITRRIRRIVGNL